MRPLTGRQQAILEFVSGFARDQGYAPSLKEIGEAVGLANVSAVRGHVTALERKGYLRRQSDQPRSISVVHAPSWVSRVKRKLHEFAQTDAGVVHQIEFGIVLATAGAAPLLGPAEQSKVRQVLDRLSAEHGWSFARVSVGADHLSVTVKVWPNHPAEVAARRIKAATQAALRRAPSAGPLWARGYAATTDLDRMDEIARQLLDASRAKR